MNTEDFVAKKVHVMPDQQVHLESIVDTFKVVHALGTDNAPPRFRTIVGGKKGRPPKKKHDRYTEEIKGVTEARQNSRAQAVAAAESNAIAELDATQGNAKTSESPARQPARISCFDDSSEDFCLMIVVLPLHHVLVSLALMIHQHVYGKLLETLVVWTWMKPPREIEKKPKKRRLV